MKKLIIVAISAVLAVMAVEPAHAQDQKVLAIIDSAIDSNKIPAVIYEACFTVSKSMACPNGEQFMEGKGSASSPLWPASMLKTVYHGHGVAQAALAANPNIKIVFLRISDITVPNATRKIIGGDQASFEAEPVVRALKWVSDNAEKYSIDAVSISQSSVSAKNLSRCSSDQVISQSVSSLISKNIPTFAATGNDSSASVVGFPACVSGVIGVGAFVRSANSLTKATNRGPGLDIVSEDSINIVRYNGTPSSFTATSAATPIAAALYLGSTKHLTVDSFINSFAKVLGQYPYIAK